MVDPVFWVAIAIFVAFPCFALGYYSRTPRVVIRDIEDVEPINLRGLDHQHEFHIWGKLHGDVIERCTFCERKRLLRNK